MVVFCFIDLLQRDPVPQGAVADPPMSCHYCACLYMRACFHICVMTTLKNVKLKESGRSLPVPAFSFTFFVCVKLTKSRIT